MSLARPEVTASLRADGVTVGLVPERLLFVGQQRPSGTAVSGALTENILNDNSWDTLYGEDAAIAAAIRRARRRNGESIFDAIGLDDNGGGAAATGTNTTVGDATEDGTLTFYVGSKKFNEYIIPVVDTDDETAVAAALVAAITADDRALVTAGNVLGVVTFTAKNKGTYGNTIGLKVVGSVAGLTNTLVAMSSGATDPVLTGVFDIVGNQRYQGIVWQFDQDLSEVTDFLDPRFNVSNNVLDGAAFAGTTDTFSNHLTTLGAENSHELTVNTGNLISRADHQGPGVLEVPFTKVAEFAGTRALRRTDDAVLGSLVIARSARDSFGGIHTNSKPYFNTPFPDLETPDVGDSFTDVEIKQLQAVGGWVIDANRPFTEVIAGPVVTTYKTDPAGNPDPTFSFLNFRDTSTAAREFIVNNTRARFPQYRATGGALINGVDSANEASVAAFVIEQFANLADLALLNSGTGTLNGEAIDFDKLHRENLFVTLNPVSGRFFVDAKMFIVTQLREVLYSIAIAFEV